MTTKQLVNNFTNQIVNPIIALLFAAALVVFVWGLIEFLMGLNGLAEAAKKEDGKRHMFYGVIGMFIMVSAYAFLQFIANNVCGGLSSCYPGS